MCRGLPPPATTPVPEARTHAATSSPAPMARQPLIGASHCFRLIRTMEHATKARNTHRRIWLRNSSRQPDYLFRYNSLQPDWVGLRYRLGAEALDLAKGFAPGSWLLAWPEACGSGR